METKQLHSWGQRRIAAVALLVVGAVFLTGAVWGTAALVFAQPGDAPRGGVGAALHALLSEEPNMLAEDHVALSCEEEFSVKVFTAEELSDATFTVHDTDTGALLYGPVNEGDLSPLWETVELGPLAALPPKITVEMSALTANGDERENELILEPQCNSGAAGTGIANNTVIINPWGKILVNPQLDVPNEAAFVPLPPLVMAVPEDLVGETVDTVVRRVSDGEIVGEGSATIETEIVALQLKGVSPIEIEGGITVPLNPPSLENPEWHVDSFFDVFFDIDFSGGDAHDTQHQVRLIDAAPLESLDGESTEGEETTIVR